MEDIKSNLSQFSSFSTIINEQSGKDERSFRLMIWKGEFG